MLIPDEPFPDFDDSHLLEENLKFPASRFISKQDKGMNYYSQSPVFQDQWVCETLNFKKDGTFVDVGCRGPIGHGNNTYAMESQLGWRGVSVDNQPQYIALWEKSDREASGAYCCDALTVDYVTLFKENNLPEIIDYLTIDLEPPQVTLEALYKIPFDKYKFRCITFETDAYRKLGTEAPSRSFLTEHGYKLVQAVNTQDDFWIFNGETEL